MAWRLRPAPLDDVRDARGDLRVGLREVGVAVGGEDALEVVPARRMPEHVLAEHLEDAPAAVVEAGAAYVLAEAVVEVPRARVYLGLREGPGGGVADGARPVAYDDLGLPAELPEELAELPLALAGERRHMPELSAVVAWSVADRGEHRVEVVPLLQRVPFASERGDPHIEAIY